MVVLALAVAVVVTDDSGGGDIAQALMVTAVAVEVKYACRHGQRGADFTVFCLY